MAELEQSNCNSCHRPIWWLRDDVTGVPASIDTRPDSNGDVILTAEGGEFFHHVLTPAERAAGVAQTRYAKHEATCPTALGMKGKS